MTWGGRRAAALGWTMAALAGACGGDDGGGGGPGGGVAPPDEAVTVQEAIEIAEFQALAAEDPDLAAVSAGLTLAAAGTLEDSAGRVVVWAEGTDGAGLRRAAVRACAAGACTSALQTVQASAATWSLADGSPATPVRVGSPVLLKNLVGQNLSGPTRVAVGALSTARGALTLDEATLPALDFATRRFVALNTFGDLFDTRLQVVTDAAAVHGGFDEIVEVQYAREEHVAEALTTLDHEDVLVWLTQGVRQETKDGWRAARTVGLTVNRAGYGETMMSRDALGEVGVNIAAGPGIVFLAAGDSYSDGSEGQPDNGAVWSRLDREDRVLIGLRGHTDVNNTLAAAQTFFGLYLSGEATLGEALDAANAALAGTGAELVTNQLDRDQLWLRRYADLWSRGPVVQCGVPGATGPAPGFSGAAVTWSSARLVTPITANVKCGPPGAPKQTVTTPDAQPFADVTFDGAYFEGQNVVQIGDADVDVTYRGVVGGLACGDRILVEVVGDLSKAYRGFHGFGEGIVRQVEVTKDGKLHIRFNGAVHATPYTNEAGDECVMGSPVLSTKTSELADLVLTP